MYKDKLISCINITYYILIILLTILSIFYVHFESGLPTSNEELDKIIIYSTGITLLINIISNFFKLENKKTIVKNILYDIGTILFFLSGGITWIFFLIGLFYFIIPINGLIINVKTLKINGNKKNEDKTIQINNKKNQEKTEHNNIKLQKKSILIICIIVLMLILLFPREKLLSRDGTKEFYSILYKVTKVHRWGNTEIINGETTVPLYEGTIVEILGIEIYNSFK